MKDSLRDSKLPRLSTLSAIDLTDIEISNYKDDIRSVMGTIPGSKYGQSSGHFRQEIQSLESVLQGELRMPEKFPNCGIKVWPPHI